MLGDTWYERGVRYWLRRAGMVIMMAVVIAIVVAVLWGLFGAIREASVTGFYIALSIEIAYSVAIIAWLVVRTARRWNNLRPAEAKPMSRREGAVLGTLVRVGSVVWPLVFVVGGLLFIGLYVAMLLAMLTPETIWERPARLEMAERLRSRGFDIPAS